MNDIRMESQSPFMSTDKKMGRRQQEHMRIRAKQRGI